MATNELTEIQFLSGLFSLIFVIIIGIIILSKYFSTHNKTFIAVGFTWIFLCSAWWPRSIDFILRIFFNTYLQEFWFLLIGVLFIPFALLFWIYSFSTLVYPNLRTKIVIVFFLIFITYEN